MLFFSAHNGLPLFNQMLHSGHVMLCMLAVLIACIPLFTPKGSFEHKYAGRIYIPISLAALILGSILAWLEASDLLFCFNAFCAYLLLSGWRAVHEKEAPVFLDWALPFCLLALALGVMIETLIKEQGTKSLYLLAFVINAFYLAWRDGCHLRKRVHWSRCKIFLVDSYAASGEAGAWMGRHVAGMVGSMIANLSVIVLTLLPLSLHWLWPMGLLMAGLAIAYRNTRRKHILRKQMLASLLSRSRKKQPRLKSEPDFRRAA